MPRNASGVYSPPSGTLAVTNTAISSTSYNNFVNDLASALTGSLPRDGSAGMQANLAMGGFKLTGLAAGTAAGEALRFEQFFPSGTLMLFQQSAAPVGWTKQTVHNDKALRVVSGTAGSGGGSAFSAVFAARTIAQANLPNVNLVASNLTGSVGTSITNGTLVTTNFSKNNFGNFQHGGGFSHIDSVSWTDSTLSLASGTVTFGGNVPLGGSGTALDFAVQYVDLIIAAKD